MFHVKQLAIMFHVKHKSTIKMLMMRTLALTKQKGPHTEALCFNTDFYIHRNNFHHCAQIFLDCAGDLGVLWA